MKISTGNKAILLIVLILIVDQVSKILVKTNMAIGESITVFHNWFFIRFIENPGMAFGIDIPGELGKPLLTIFRIIAVIAIGWYMHQMVGKNARPGFIYFMALIFAGAMGNIIDCVIYGRIFNESTYFTVASMFPEGGGYASLLHGKVVDMFYFPILQGRYPGWFPWLGGQEYIFFRPIFNVADASISIGIICILLFQRRYFHEQTIIAEVSGGSVAERGEPVADAGKPVTESSETKAESVEPFADKDKSGAESSESVNDKDKSGAESSESLADKGKSGTSDSHENTGSAGHISEEKNS